MWLLKAKKYAVGTKRKRKTGWWIKDRPGHWRMLTSHIRDQHKKDDVHPNHAHAKLMQQAAKKIVRQLGQNRAGYSRSIADSILDSEYKNADIKRFSAWKKRVLDGVEKYLKEMGAAYGGEKVRNPSDHLNRLQKWQDDLSEASLYMHSQIERDQWVSDRFKARNLPVSHILYAARELIGRDVHLSQVPKSGFKGFCKAIITKIYEHGPDGLSKDQIKIWEKAFNTTFNKGSETVVPLAKALSLHKTKSFYKKNPKWFVYCCTRYAMKNDGAVDMAAIEPYMKNAMRYHGSKNPPSPTYDQMDETALAAIKLGMVQPKLVKKPTSRRKAAGKIYLKKKRQGRRKK